MPTSLHQVVRSLIFLRLNLNFLYVTHMDDKHQADDDRRRGITGKSSVDAEGRRAGSYLASLNNSKQVNNTEGRHGR